MERRAPGCAKRSGSATRQSHEEALVVRRDSTGKHVIEARDLEAEKKEPGKRLSSSGRLNMTADQLLPNMPKLRSQNSTSSDLNMDTDSDMSPLSLTAPDVMMPTTSSKHKRSTMTKTRTVTSIPSGRTTPVSTSKTNSVYEADLNKPRVKRPSSAGGANQERGRSPQRQRPASARSSSSSRLPAATPMRQLPETPKKPAHSKTIDIPDAKADVKSNLSHMRRNSMSSATFSLNVDYEDYPEAPPENEDLNAKMEMLFEEYKKVELSLIEKDAKARELREKEKESKKKERQQNRRSRSVTREVILAGSTKEPSRPNRASSTSRPSAPAFGASTTKPQEPQQRPSRKSGLASMANPPNANTRKGHFHTQARHTPTISLPILRTDTLTPMELSMLIKSVIKPTPGAFGFRSRLPMPGSFQGKVKAKDNRLEPNSLKRCDSGVDINNLSPSDNSNHCDDDSSSWQAQDRVIPPPVLNDPLDLENDDDYF
ncbi:hypothetical protein CAPTEDRAFT_190839 [Capitella teleta]|uniref:Uncharacterized protein n=1 Tax=Capitella teleta TaxID=283909 RepID=R7TXZ5_CAPTE|nr:hypothetical protein CAPTEDRAFT_190839 [Capitella teleta]|eukprot:ELT98624.1 hypothetical protein CAPTEDRAFT_190839 [Capitella teleta]